jgi:hypothetical protein
MRFSETEFCIRLQVDPTQLEPIDIVSFFLRVQVSLFGQNERFDLKKEAKFSYETLHFNKRLKMGSIRYGRSQN